MRLNIILDIDGTLWDTTGVVSKAWNMASKDVASKGYENYIITADMLKKEFGKPMIVIVQDLFPALNEEEQNALMEACGAYEKKVMEENTDDLTYEGVKETMDKLSEKHNLYIVSNCRNGYIEHTMKRIGIKDIIKDYECYGRTGMYKTDNIKLLMQRNNIKEAVYVGDTLGDYTSAKEAGLEFAFASYGFGEVKNPDYVLKQFSDLLFLESWKEKQ